MQSIASEINYSETVYSKAISEKNSAKVELPKNGVFAGHPNVGAGYFLFKPHSFKGTIKRKNDFEELAGLVYVLHDMLKETHRS